MMQYRIGYLLPKLFTKVQRIYTSMLEEHEHKQVRKKYKIEFQKKKLDRYLDRCFVMAKKELSFCKFLTKLNSSLTILYMQIFTKRTKKNIS